MEVLATLQCNNEREADSFPLKRSSYSCVSNNYRRLGARQFQQRGPLSVPPVKPASSSLSTHLQHYASTCSLYNSEILLWKKMFLCKDRLRISSKKKWDQQESCNAENKSSRRVLTRCERPSRASTVNVAWSPFNDNGLPFTDFSRVLNEA